MKFKDIRITNVTVALGLALMVSIISVSFGAAQDHEAYIGRVPSMEPEETGLLSPAGLAFSSQAKSFYVIEGQGQGLVPLANSEVVVLSPLADRQYTASLAAAIEDPLNIVFDDLNDRLLAYQPSTGQLLEVRQSPGGGLDRSTITRDDLKRLAIQDPQGLALDAKSGSLFILDAAGPRIVRLQPGSGNSFTSANTSTIDLALVAPRGMAFNPASGHLFVFDGADQTLYELAQDGRIVTTRSLLPFNLKSPQSMVFAPSSDQTDDPAQMNLFVADSGLISGRGSGAGTASSLQVQGDAGTSVQSTGQIVELSLVQPASAEATSFTSALVRTTDLSKVNPPSPDPSGIAYLPGSNSLIVSDGEVEETVNGITHFQGANVWELTMTGSIIRTANISAVKPTSVAMSDEPTGVAWNPNNGHYYFSDDTGSIDVYDLNPGPDNLVGTSDDSWTAFSGDIYGNGDAEGIAYDSLHNHLFVVDGINAEVYEYTLSGTLVHQFDVSTYGVADPESVEFNSSSGTLYVMSSNSSSPIIVETTTDGVLIQTIDISAAQPNAVAGIAYAPASNGSGAPRFYIVDRGVDNNTDPNIIDGKMYEMSAPPSGPTPTAAQFFTPTNTSTPPPPGGPFYASFGSGGTLGGVSFADEDVLTFDGQNWSLLFDGSDVGLGSVDVTAISIENEDSILMAFNTAITLNGIAVTPQDIVRFEATSFGSNTAGTFSMYFNGIDVGLDATGENIDALSALPDGRILISTTGSPTVPGVTGRDEDILAFAPTALGDNTSGAWTMYFDGSDVGLANTTGEDIDAADVVGGNVFLSTTGDFSVTGITGTDEDVFICSPSSLGNSTACGFSSSLYFDGSTWGLSANDLDAFNLGTGSNPVPTTAPSATPTPTNTPISGSSPTFTPTSAPAGDSFFASFGLSGTLSAVSFADEDILRYDGQSWSMWFDGSDVGAGAIDLFGFSMVDADTVLISFSNLVTLNGISVTQQDIVQFDATSLGANTAGTFSMYFNGIDVGLDTTGEGIDALAVLPDGRILISTVGDLSVPGLTAKDEDIVAFTPTTLGNNTSGTWALYFDGSDVGLADTTDEDINALDVVGGNLYLSTNGLFSVPGLDGAGEDVFVCVPSSLGDVTACSYSPTLFFDGSAWGLSGNDLDGLHVASVAPAMPLAAAILNDAVPSSTPTATTIILPSPTGTSLVENTPTETPTAPVVPDSTGTPTPTGTP